MQVSARIRQSNMRQNKMTVRFLVIFALGLVIRIYTNPPYMQSLGTLQTGIYIGLLLGWCILTHHRLIQKGILKYITAMCVLLMVWFVLRWLKYYIVPGQTVMARYLWYSYYFPMLLYPLCALLAVVHIERPDDWTLSKRYILLFIIPIIITVIVLTNDLHQGVFVFPETEAVWSDISYGYGILYALPFGWFLFCVIATLLVMIRRYRIPIRYNPFVLLALLPPVFGLFYNLAYISGRAFFTDLTIAMSFFSILTFEIAIRFGLIRSNSNYTDIFQLSSVSAQILGKDLEARYVSDSFTPYPEDLLQEILGNGRVVQNGLQISSLPIKGGYVIWQENVSDLYLVREQLEEANESLEEKTTAQSRLYSTKMKRRRLEEQRRLFQKMQEETAVKRKELSKHIEAFAVAEGKQEAEELLSIAILNAYLKRRNNLVFLAEGDRRFPTSELRNCINETAKVLETFGVICQVYIDATVQMLFEDMVFFYDSFETIIEETIAERPTYFVSLTVEEHAQMLGIRVAGISSMSVSIPNMMVSQEEGEFLLTIQVPGKEIADE